VSPITGPPHSIHVSPESFNIENGDNVTLAIEIHDIAGNVTAYQRSNATVKVSIVGVCVGCGGREGGPDETTHLSIKDCCSELSFLFNCSYIVFMN